MALESAEKNRSFEIELYWKRSAYFWTFVGLAFAGYGALQLKDKTCNNSIENLEFLLSNLGFIASLAWFQVNRGSKFWQENWEAQVEQLEDSVTGSLYKKATARIGSKCEGKRFVQWTSGAPKLSHCPPGSIKSLRVASVSKINQLSSLYIVCVWISIGLKTSPWTRCGFFDKHHTCIFLVLTLTAGLFFFLFGKTKRCVQAYCRRVVCVRCTDSNCANDGGHCDGR